MTKKNKWRLRSSIGVKTNRPFFRSSSFNAKIWLGFMDWLTPRLPENPNQKIKFVNRQNLELKVAIWRKKCYLRSNTYFRSSSFNVFSRAKIGIGVKTENLSNDRIQNWIQTIWRKKISNIGVKTNRLFFSIIFIQRFAAKIGIGVMKWLTPRLMLEHHFDELSNGVWHPIHSGNLDSETPNNRRFDWLMWPFPQIPIHQRCKHQQCNTNPRQLARYYHNAFKFFIKSPCRNSMAVSREIFPIWFFHVI